MGTGWPGRSGVRMDVSHRKRSRSVRDNPLLRAFQDRLESLRRERGFSRKGFADHLGLPHSSYAILLGDDANPTLGTIVWVAERVGLDPRAMFGDADPEGGPSDASRRRPVQAAETP